MRSSDRDRSLWKESSPAKAFRSLERPCASRCGELVVEEVVWMCPRDGLGPASDLAMSRVNNILLNGHALRFRGEAWGQALLQVGWRFHVDAGLGSESRVFKELALSAQHGGEETTVQDASGFLRNAQRLFLRMWKLVPAVSPAQRICNKDASATGQFSL